MKFTFFIYLFFVSLTSLLANDTTHALISVKYETKHLKDTSKKFYSTDYIDLHIGKNFSKYYNFQLQQIEDNPNTVKKEIPLSSYDNAYYHYYGEKRLVTEQTLALTKYLMELEYPIIKWTILHEEKNILGFNCQLATGYFKGRNYNAWFCSELNFNAGPWKFSGLPGVILEIEDFKREVSFKAVEIQDISQKDLQLTFSKKVIKTTLKEYLKVVDAYMENPLAFLENGGQVKLINPPTVKKIKKINNPIELSDK